jgi:hypothetical protein
MAAGSFFNVAQRVGAGAAAMSWPISMLKRG